MFSVRAVDGSCLVCRSVLTWFRSIVKSGMTVDEIIDYGVELCTNATRMHPDVCIQTVTSMGVSYQKTYYYFVRAIRTMNAMHIDLSRIITYANLPDSTPYIL